MLEQTCVPLRAGRLQGESLVAPVKKEPAQVIYLNAKRSSDALPQYGTVSRNGAAEYLWLSSSSDPLPKYGKTTDSSVTDLLNTSASNNIRSAIAELKKRRARLFALAHAAEARAHEAEEKCERAENRLEQETNQRLVAEQKLRELKEDSLRLLGAEACAHEDAERHLMFGLLVFENGRDKQKTRRKAEKKRPVIELKKWEKERELRNTEERHRQQENGPKNFIIYGAAITLLVGACWLLIAAFL